MASNNTYTVRPDATPENGYREYDTVSGIAAEWVKQNPSTGLSVQQVAKQIIKENGLQTKDGSECGEHIDNAFIRIGQTLELPQGNRVTNPRQHREQCPEVVPEAAPDMVVKAPLPPLAQERHVDFTPKAKLPDYPALGTAGNSEIYSVINAPMMLGHMPDQPAIAARGRNPNHTGAQTVGDAVRLAMDVQMKAIKIAVSGQSYMVMPFHLQTPDSAGYAQAEKQGSNGMTDNAESPNNAWLRAHNQWPFNLQINPFSNSDFEFRDATLLPGLGTVVDENGAIKQAPNTKYPNNFVTAADGGTPSVTLSRTAVKSGLHEENEWSWGTPSAPVPLVGSSNYAMASYVDNVSIVPKIEDAADEIQRAGNNPTKAQFENLVGLVNYRSTLVGISNYPVNADVSQPLSQDKIDALNPAEVLAYQRARVLEQAEKAGITDVDPNYLPAESPIRSVPKEKMREQLIEYYTKMADKDSVAFERIYKEDEIVGKSNPHSLGDLEGRKAAATEFVEHLPLYKTYPENGVELKEVDRLVSTRDPNHPTVLQKNNFNPIERSEIEPKSPISADSQTAAMGVIAADPALVSTLLENAGTNRKLAEALVERDRKSMDMPGEFSNHLTKIYRSGEGMEERGYSKEQMDTTFASGPGQSISRGNFEAIQRDLAASASNPEAVALRQEDLRGTATDGSGRIDAFPVGSLQTQMLHALATEKGNKTLLALEEKIRETSPTDAAEKIEALRAGVTSAKNAKSEQILGASHDQIKDYTSAQGVVSAARAGTPIEEGTTTKETGSKVDTGYAHTIMSKIAGQAGTAAALVAAQAEQGSEQSREAVLDAAATLSAKDRLAVAKAALAGVDNAGDMNTKLDVADSLGGMAQYAKLVAKMTSKDAERVLQAVKSGEAEKTALAGIAASPNAAQLVAAQLAEQDPQLIATLTKQLGTDGAKNVASTLEVPVADLTSIHPHKTETVHTTVTAPASAEPFIEASKTGINGSREQASAVVHTFFNDPSTTAVAMEQLTSRQPVYAAAIVLQTLDANPALMQSVADSVDPGVIASTFGTGADSKKSDLSSILSKLAEARKENDTQAANESAAELSKFAADPANAGAMQALVSQTLHAPHGRAALLATINETLGNAKADVEHPLAAHSFTSEQTLASLYDAVVKADPSNAAELSAKGLVVLDNLPVTPGFVIPGIAFPLELPDHKNPERSEPLPRGRVNECTDIISECVPPEPEEIPLPTGEVAECVLTATCGLPTPPTQPTQIFEAVEVVSGSVPDAGAIPFKAATALLSK